MVYHRYKLTVHLQPEGLHMTFSDTQRSVISIIALLVYGAVGYYVEPSQVQRAQYLIFMIIFGIGYTCTIRKWSSPVSVITTMGVFIYGLLFIEKQNAPPYLVPGWQLFIGALIALEATLLIWRTQRPQELGQS